jgi:hypothetical protein
VSSEEFSTPEKAYEQLLTLHGTMKLIAKDMQPFFKYSPFEYLPGKVLTEIQDIRAKLIENRAEHFRQLYTPNMKPQVDFQKLMKEKCGEFGFKESVIEEWFKAQAQDGQQLSSQSLEQILHATRHLVPYRTQGGEWGYERDWQQLIDKLNPRVLVLRCYSWNGGHYSSGINYHLNENGELNALESLVDIVTQPGTDPATVKPQPWISSHAERARQDAEQFYGKHLVAHLPVLAFQFFKNEKLLVWFRSDREAEAVARMLTSGALAPAAAAPSPIAS